MPISTSYFFDRATAQITQAQQRVAQSQAQLSTGKQLLAPSDNPDQSTVIARIKTSIARQESIGDNLNTMEQHFVAEETALRSTSDIMVRIKELGIQAANDTLGPTDRSLIAVELSGLREQLMQLANTQDEEGHFLFSGTRVKTASFSATSTYEGDQTRTRLSSGDQRVLEYRRAGTDVFQRVIDTDNNGDTVGVGFFQALDNFITAVDTSDGANIQAGLTDIDTMYEGTILALAGVGADINAIETQRSIIDETVLRLKTTLSDVEDLDYAEAVTKMNKEMLSLEAAMSSFSKISQMNLFNYIR